jgi:hypothetical protein
VTRKLDGSNGGGNRNLSACFQEVRTLQNSTDLSLLFAGVAAPIGEGPDGDENCQANAEIDDDSEIVSADMPRGRRQVGHDEEVHDVPRQHGDERLREIHPSWI